MRKKFLLFGMSCLLMANYTTFFLTQTHYQIEELLKASKLGWTILQPNSFMQNWLGDLS